MKNKIRLDKLQTGLKSSLLTREKRHRISLGNGLTVYFTNINEAKSYLNATNRFLNNLMHNLSNIYIQLWSEYRKLQTFKIPLNQLITG